MGILDLFRRRKSPVEAAAAVVLRPRRGRPTKAESRVRREDRIRELETQIQEAELREKLRRVRGRGRDRPASKLAGLREEIGAHRDLMNELGDERGTAAAAAGANPTVVALANSGAAEKLVEILGPAAGPLLQTLAARAPVPPPGAAGPRPAALPTPAAEPAARQSLPPAPPPAPTPPQVADALPEALALIA